MKKYFSILLISFLLYQCKKKENSAEEITPKEFDSASIDFSHPCRISSFSSGMETRRYIYKKDKENKIIEITTNYYTAVEPGSIKTMLEYNTQGQLVKKYSQVLLPSPGDGGSETYEYDAQGRVIKKITFISSNGITFTEFWEYNKENKVEKIKQNIDNVESLNYMKLIYDIDGDLIRIDWCNTFDNKYTTMESYEYDKTKPYCKTPESFFAQSLMDVQYPTHFLKKKNTHNSKSEIASSTLFQIEETLSNGYPIRISAYLEVAPNQKVTYIYDYDCK